MGDDTKMHPTWKPTSIQNLKNAGKNCIRALMPKFDAKKKSKQIKTVRQPHFFIDFGSIFWSCQGVISTRYRIYRIDYNNLTRALPRRGAADQKSHPKSMPKPSKTLQKTDAKKNSISRGSTRTPREPPWVPQTLQINKTHKASEERHIQTATYRPRHTRPSNTPRAPSGPERIYWS